VGASEWAALDPAQNGTMCLQHSDTRGTFLTSPMTVMTGLYVELEAFRGSARHRRRYRIASCACSANVL
jgi:hypothetical protein